MKRACKAWLLAAVMVGSVVSAVCAEVTFKVSPYVRARYEYWKNYINFSDDAVPGDDVGFYRMKLSLTGQMDIDNKYSAVAKLTNESKIFTQRDGKDEQFNINEAVFDNLYVDVKNAFDMPLGLRIGRQDLAGLYGENFLIGDGTPKDGSRTFYFNALKASWKINDKSSLDALYLKSYKWDQFAVINRQEGTVASQRNAINYVNASNEDGYVLYHKMNVSDALKVEDYFMRKDEWLGGLGNRINTLGALAKYAFESPLSIKGQLAYQFGKDIVDEDIAAFGGYGFAELNYKDAAMKPQFSAGYIYLSGDDPDTTKDEGFNPLYSRSPWLSELLSLTLGGYWTNLGVAKVTAAVAPCEKTKLAVGYNQLSVNKAPAGVSTDFGSLITGRIDYAFSKTVTAYLLGEYFTPGGYIKDAVGGEDNAMFVRSEVQLKF